MSDQEENEQDFEAGEAEDAEDIIDQVIGVPLTKGKSNFTARPRSTDKNVLRYDGQGTQSVGKSWKW